MRKRKKTQLLKSSFSNQSGIREMCSEMAFIGKDRNGFTTDFYNGSGLLYQYFSFKDGSRDGLFLVFFTNGVLASKRTNCNGRELNGEVELFFKNGFKQGYLNPL
jgi:antitoxin component YwqK of YwqJK toxin-antitoxin module